MSGLISCDTISPEDCDVLLSHGYQRDKTTTRLQPDAYTSAGKHRSDIAYFHIQMEAFDPI